MLKAMHASHQEQRSTALRSSTADFAQDAMLYYQPISDTSSAADFQKSLRAAAHGGDDSFGRSKLLEAAWRRFSAAVQAGQVSLSSSTKICRRQVSWH
jgi:hypothetical protein